MNSVFQDWIFSLSMQQQSVLILACRGPDGVGKFHPCKPLVARYRASILKAAYLGRAMRIDEHDATTFMSLKDFSDNAAWAMMLTAWFDNVDAIPHHYYMHICHGAAILGYHHPHELFSRRWRDFYFACSDDLHLRCENKDQLDERLNDWGQEHWDAA